jgi:biotin transport system substrate-specific component
LISHAHTISRCALLAALNCLCAWIAVPLPPIGFTMQSFSVVLTLLFLGGRLGTVTIGVYLLLGAVGLPVFSGFRGGPGILLGATGGFLLGFFAMGLVYWAVTAVFGRKVRVLGCVLGLFACYAVGAFWFSILYAQGEGIWAVISQCVLPFLVPDGLKLLLALRLSRRLNG